MMIKNSRRSALVNAMFLPTRTTVTLSDGELFFFQKSLSHALSLLINLEELHTYGSGSNPSMRYLVPWMFADCLFRLRTFFLTGWIVSSLAPVEGKWLEVLRQQDGIERCDMRLSSVWSSVRLMDNLSMRSGNHGSSLQFLPRLSTIKIQDYNVLQTICPRALVHLQLTVGPDSMTRNSIDMFEANLKAVQSTLTHLSFYMRNYSWEVPDEWGVMNVLIVIGKSLLGLKFLEFSAFKQAVSIYYALSSAKQR
jgi:hypothetical protein